MMGTSQAALALWFMLVLPGNLMDMVSEYEYNKQLNLVTIRLTEDMGDGTDGNCEAAAKLFHAICSQGYLLYVKPYRTGGWVPSSKNPMDIKWTTYLIQEDPRIPGGKSVKAKPPDRKREAGEPKSRTREYEVDGKRIIIKSWD